MSLKAKLEAVVYAAEEPVTLAQLAAIFADEVLPESGEAAEPEAEQIALTGLSSETVAPDSGTEEAPAPEETSPAAEASEGDEKKAARQRDRRVRQLLQ